MSRPPNHWKLGSVIIGIIFVALLTMGATSCSPAPGPGGSSLTITAYRESGLYGSAFDLNNSWGSPALPLLVGHVNSCFNINDGGTGYLGTCRVVNGYDQSNYTYGANGTGALYDKTDWDIKIVAGHAYARFATGGYGLSVTMYSSPKCQGSCSPNGAANMFEGCRQIAAWDGVWPLHGTATSTDEYHCAFAVYDDAPTKQYVHGAGWDQAFQNAWPAFRNTLVDPATCAFGVMGLTADVPFALKLLNNTSCGVMTVDQLRGSSQATGPGDTTTTVPGAPMTFTPPTANVLPDDPALPGDPTPVLPPDTTTTTIAAP